ncbi:hypothetical protein Pelo_9132 [Pelomyxa schiedti]|nr:hypothetical protein Pelo_9132 [Pelomyxa schiedti]
MSVGVPTGGDAAHESVVIRTSFPLVFPVAFPMLSHQIFLSQCKDISVQDRQEHLIDRPAAVFPGSNPASSLWDENNFWSTAGFARLTVPPVTTQASVFLTNMKLWCCLMVVWQNLLAWYPKYLEENILFS